MALLSVWPSALTGQLESYTDHILKDSHENSLVYDSVNFKNFTVSEIKAKLNDNFNELVKLTASDPALHIVAVIPFFEKDAFNQIDNVCSACSAIEHNVTLHVLGLCEGLSTLFEKIEDKESLSQNQEKSIETIKRYSEISPFPCSFTLIDDYAETGVTIGFSIKSLARYIALIELALGLEYYSILSPSLLGAHKGDNISFGLSTLSFDRKSTVTRLLGRGFVAALDNVGINNNDVNAQKAAHEAESFLIGIARRYPDLYEKKIRPLYKEQGITEGKTVAKTAEIIKEDLESIRKDIIDLLGDETFSLPEKEAILAMILGRDNVTLHGIQYEHEGTILDDVCEEPINLYVKAFNEYCKDTKWLPVRQDFEGLKIKKWNELEGKYEDVPENHEALNPLPEIKRLKQQILNTTSFLREKNEELEGLKKSEKLRKDVEEIKRKWVKPEGTLRDFEYKEQPLDEKYIPDYGNKLKDVVDLREFFSPVRNQQDLGSCTSFAVTSMYEALMNRGAGGSHKHLSPGFLYYYSNILKGRPQGGSNFHDQLEVLGCQGVCRDELYAYDPNNPSKEPTSQAKEDAETHRVLKAKQIVVRKTPDKGKDLKFNHSQLTNALSEGYPVGISLKIFDNLGKEGPLVEHPKETPNAKEEGYHAMVIAGYSEENGFYIVRNSWGSDFGDQGYCYVPFSYIDDPDFLDFACIITEITDNTEGDHPGIPTSPLANFALTETEIRKSAIKNVMATVRYELQDIQNLYAEYYAYYQKLMLRLTMPTTQNNIRQKAQIGQSEYVSHVEAQKKKLEDTFVSQLKDYKKTLRNIILSSLATAIVFGIGWYYTDSIVLMILFIVAAGVGVLTWLGYKWWVRQERKRLQEQLDEVAVNVKKQREILLEMQIRFHVAGMWISNFHKLSLEIGNIYDRLVSFNDTLRSWQKQYEDKIGYNENSEGIMFRSLDPGGYIDKFFDENKEAIVNRIKLLDVFEDYQANIEDLDRSHQSLDQSVIDSIESLMRNFNIVNYLLGERYPYLGTVDVQKEFDDLIKLGQPSFRNKAHNATSPVRMVLANVEHGLSSQWSNTITPFFPLRPICVQYSDSTTLILLTLHPQSL